MMNFLIVFVGGGIGAVFRYWLSGAVYKFSSGSFPLGTLAVNIIGSFLIGFLMILMEGRFLAPPSVRIFLTIGILGGFTTFSSFSYETISLMRDGELLLSVLNIGASVIVCLFATYIGTVTAKLM